MESKALDVLRERGYVEWSSHPEELAELFDREMVTAYVGFDPTADSLHVGHLIPLMGLAWLQRLGHRPVMLAGGGTGMIGDPSMKSQERNLLTPQQVENNIIGVKKQLEQLVDFDCGANSALIVNNYDWLSQISMLDFLRDVGKYFSVNYMIRKEHVRSRIDDPTKTLSYTEFTYTLLQAYDFRHLYHTYGCKVQFGGNDQQGNIVGGIELIRKWDGCDAFGATNPLLLTSSGVKFGKTEAGAVWLDAQRTSPYRFYQFWINSEDDAVEKLLKLFTFIPTEKISEIMTAHKADPSRREAQKCLAKEVTAMIHSEEAAAMAIRASEILFGSDVEPSELSDAMMTLIAEEAEGGSVAALPISLVDALAESGACKSKSEARRLIDGGGLSVNGCRVTSVDHRVEESDLLAGRRVLLRLGKKKYFVLSVS